MSIHVPLLASVPARDGLRLPEGPMSMIDLFPTIVNLAGLEVDYKGYGLDFLGSAEPFRRRWVYSELDNSYGSGFLNPGNLEAARERVTSRVAMDGVELKRDVNGLLHVVGLGRACILQRGGGRRGLRAAGRVQRCKSAVRRSWSVQGCPERDPERVELPTPSGTGNHTCRGGPSGRKIEKPGIYRMT